MSGRAQTMAANTLLVALIVGVGWLLVSMNSACGAWCEGSCDDEGRCLAP